MSRRHTSRLALALATLAGTLVVLFFLPVLILGVLHNELWPTAGYACWIVLVVELVRDEWKAWRG